MDIEKLEQLIQGVGPENVPLVFTCITNNPICGQPVSMANIREINRVAHKYDIPLVFDVARWAENCYFIKMNEEGYADKSIAEIATEMFSYCDAFTMSAKKDGHANMGGMLAFRDTRPVLEEVLRLQRGRHRQDRRGRAHQGQADLLLRQRLLRRHVRP